jgi:hypothetical protein
MVITDKSGGNIMARHKKPFFGFYFQNDDLNIQRLPYAGEDPNVTEEWTYEISRRRGRIDSGETDTEISIRETYGGDIKAFVEAQNGD